MNEWAESLLKKIRDDEKTVRELEPALDKARQHLLLCRKLYALETGTEIAEGEKSSVQLAMELAKTQRKPFEKRG